MLFGSELSPFPGGFVRLRSHPVKFCVSVGLHQQMVPCF